MTDVVISLPVLDGDEASLFGSFFNRFVESRSAEAERHAQFADAPYLMLRSDPQPGHELKVLTFQERAAAQAFSSGWAQARRGLRPGR